MNESFKSNQDRMKVNVDDLINRTKAEDQKGSKTLRSVYILYVVLSVFYTLLFVANPDPDLTRYDRIAGLLYVLAFTAGALFFRKEFRMLNRMDYTLPLITLIRGAEVRYRFFGYKWWYLLFIVTLIGAGLSFSFRNPARLTMFSETEKLFFVQAVYWSVIFLSALLGYFHWKKRSYPVWRDAKKLLEELEG
jgi:hypothetical protein